MNFRLILKVIFIGYFIGLFVLSSNILFVYFVFFGECKLIKIIYFGNV